MIPFHFLKAEESKIIPDIVYGHKDGLAMTMDFFEPNRDPNGAAILFMVSGGWYSQWTPPEQTRNFFKIYLDAGFRVFAVRHGSSPRYSIPEAVSDVQRAVRFVKLNAKDYNVDPDRLGVFGMSAGGHLSLMLGTTGDDGDSNGRSRLEQTSSRVSAVVAFVPPTDLRVAVWESPDSLPAYRNFPALDLEMSKAEDNSPLVHVTKDDAPSLVIMGGKDELVPPKHGRWIHEAFEKSKVVNKLIVYPDSDHGLSRNQDKAFQEALSWFNSHLSK